MTELRPCPYCGSEDIILIYKDNALVWEVCCQGCFMHKTYVDQESLEHLWNRRPLEDALQAKLDKAILALEKSKLFIETYVPNMAHLTIVDVLKEIKE